MNQVPPEWNPADVADSFARLAEAYNDKARIDFLAAGAHPQLLWLVRDDGRMAVFPMGRKHRDEMIDAMMASMREHNPYGVIHVVKGKVVLEQSKKGLAASPTTKGKKDQADPKPGSQIDALIVASETRDGVRRMWINPIIHGDGKTVKLALADTVVVNGLPVLADASIFPPKKGR